MWFIYLVMETVWNTHCTAHFLCLPVKFHSDQLRNSHIVWACWNTIITAQIISLSHRHRSPSLLTASTSFPIRSTTSTSPPFPQDAGLWFVVWSVELWSLLFVIRYPSVPPSQWPFPVWRRLFLVSTSCSTRIHTRWGFALISLSILAL